MRILVTGCTGFAGGFLVDALAAAGASVFGVCRRPPLPGQAPHLDGKLADLLSCDLDDRSACEAVLRQVRPERIFHLAGYANVGKSYREPDAAWQANLGITRNLCEAVLRWGEQPRIVVVSSGLIYGEPDATGALMTEDSPLRPVSPYAASKAAADLAAFQYGVGNKLEVIRARAFNHIGPRQSPEFAAPNFARQIAAIEQGRQPPVLETGDLRPRRDLTDVRDMAAAYCLLGEQGRPGEAYNIGSGAAHSMQTVLDRLLALARVPITVKQNPALLRATDPAALRADAGKLHRATGWAPRYTLDQTLRDTLDYWRQQ